MGRKILFSHTCTMFVLAKIEDDWQEEIAREFLAPVYFQRYWLWGKRQNKTHHPNRPLTLLEESYTVNILCFLIIFFITFATSLCGFSWLCSHWIFYSCCIFYLVSHIYFDVYKIFSLDKINNIIFTHVICICETK